MIVTSAIDEGNYCGSGSYTDAHGINKTMNTDI